MNSKVAKLALVAVAVVGLVVVVILGRNRAQQNRMSVSTSFIMDTVIEQKLFGAQSQQAVEEIEQRLREYEQQFSMYVSDSQISNINQNAGKQYTEVSAECLELLERAIYFCEQSNGLFDVTIAPLTSLWDITGENPHVPAQSEIDAARQLVDYRDILIDGNRVMLRREGQSLDLGAVAKGAACDIVREVAEEYDIQAGYVSIGGNLIVLGKTPDGQNYRFGVRDPQGDASEYLGTLTLNGMTMATTGAYERYFEEDGVRYHHVLDPRTGYPADSDLLSVSVISEDGLLADCLSTSLFIEGKDAVLAKMNESDYQLIAVDTEGNVYYSSSLAQNFTPNTQNAHEYCYVAVEEGGGEG